MSPLGSAQSPLQSPHTAVAPGAVPSLAAARVKERDALMLALSDGLFARDPQHAVYRDRITALCRDMLAVGDFGDIRTGRFVLIAVTVMTRACDVTPTHLTILLDCLLCVQEAQPDACDDWEAFLRPVLDHPAFLGAPQLMLCYRHPASIGLLRGRRLLYERGSDGDRLRAFARSRHPGADRVLAMLIHSRQRAPGYRALLLHGVRTNPSAYLPTAIAYETERGCRLPIPHRAFQTALADLADGAQRAAVILRFGAQDTTRANQRSATPDRRTRRTERVTR